MIVIFASSGQIGYEVTLILIENIYFQLNLDK